MTRFIRLSASGVVAGLLAMLAAGAATAAETCATMGATQFFDQIRYCVTSVLGPRSGNTYGPRNLFDNNDRTAWCEGARGTGAGQRLTLHIEGGSSFRRFLIMNGYQKSSTVFYNNARPRTIEVTTDTGVRFREELPDSMGKTFVNLPASRAYRTLSIEIIDVYPGRTYADSCINEVLVDFEYDEMLFQQRQDAGVPEQPSEDDPSPVTPPVKPLDFSGDLEDLPDLPDR